MNWSGTRVLVTGAAGFIGSHLTESLVERGARVRAFVRYNSAGTAGWLNESPRRSAIEIIPGDITDADSVLSAMKGCAHVFHLAALIGIPYSYEAPRSYVRVNVEGTLNVLNAARALSVDRVVHTSTSEVYGTARYVPIDEGHPLQGQSPYSASKIAADKLAESFFCAFGVPVVTVRPFNTYGPRQSARAVVPTIVSQALKRQPIDLGNLTPTRDLNFVADTVEGFLAAAGSPAAAGEVFNLGTGQEISIGQLAETVLDIMGVSLPVRTQAERIRPEKSEVERLCANADKARKVLGWLPRFSLREGLSQTLSWLEKHLDRYRTDCYVV